MNKIFRWYNQNIFRFWLGVIIVIFIIFIIQFFNKDASNRNNENTKEEETVSDTVSYDNVSKSIITDNSVSDKYKNEMGKVIDEFFTACIEGEPNKAYDYLSEDMKKEYPNEELFENLYYKDKFDGDKQYSFQSWYASGDVEIYVVKIFDDMLSTGKSSNSEYIEDYVTVVSDEDTFKLNLNGYVGNRKINMGNNNELIDINIDSVKEYIDYSIYVCDVKNKTDNQITLDTRKKRNTLYLVGANDVKFKSLLYENSKNDLILKPQEYKTVEIKFNVEYGKKMKSINFDNIVIDNNEEEEQKLEVEI